MTIFTEAVEMIADAIRRTDVGLCGEIFCEAGRTPCSCAVDLGNVSLTALLAFLSERGLRVVPVETTEGMVLGAIVATGQDREDPSVWMEYREIIRQGIAAAPMFGDGV